MEQRRLRLGDILDDYCPRERRVTNHAVVAMIDETIKQTRCTTCDAEHPYKGGQAPRRRKKEGTSALYKEVLAGKGDKAVELDTGDVHLDTGEGHDELHDEPHDDGPDVNTQDDVYPPEVSAPILAADVEIQSEADSNAQPEDGPVHRQLIRATLPRIEGFKEERRPTDFTIRQPGGRGGNNMGNHSRGNGGNDRSRHGRGGQGHGGNGGFGGNAHRGNGNRAHGGQRFAHRGQGQGQGQGRGQGQGGQGRHGGGRKRSR